ncbi:hypothetical protein ACFFRR_005078 [Megaselia abdita]
MLRDGFPVFDSNDDMTASSRNMNSSMKPHPQLQQQENIDRINHKEMTGMNVDLKNGSNVQNKKNLLPTPLYEYSNPTKSSEVIESETLDLSLRKLTREQPTSRTSPSTTKMCSSVTSVPPAQYRNCTPTQQHQQQQQQQQQSMYVSYSLPDSHNMSQMPSTISLISTVNSRQSQQRNVVSPHQQNHNKQQQQSLQKSPKQQQQQQQPVASPNFAKGSITHGTPFILSNSQSPYMQSNYSKHENNKTGSITQGTPLITATGNQFDMGKNAARIYSSSPQSGLQSSNKYSKPSYVSHPYAFNAQKLSSKELVLHDYMTSQQMQQKYKKGDTEEQQKSSNIQYYDKDKPSEHANR